jgi:hypothetical protein
VTTPVRSARNPTLAKSSSPYLDSLHRLSASCLRRCNRTDGGGRSCPHVW